jgi:hypothetical protein
MKQTLFFFGSALAAWAGMAALCFQSPSQRHRMGLCEQTRRQRRPFIAAAVALLAMSLAAAVAANGASFGIVLWLCQTGVLGLALVCLLPYWPLHIAHLWRMAAIAATAALVAGNWL